MKLVHLQSISFGKLYNEEEYLHATKSVFDTGWIFRLTDATIMFLAQVNIELYLKSIFFLNSTLH